MVKETIKCKICGSEMTQLGRHLKTKHGINGKEYQEKFPCSPLMSEARRKKNSNKSISPNNIEFWLKKGLSKEEAEINLRKHKKKISEHSKKKSPFSLQYWIDKGLSKEEANKHLSGINKRDKKFFIEKYGHDIGIEKYQHMQDKKSYSNSLKKMKDEGLSDYEINEIIEHRWNNVSKKAFIERFGSDIGIEKYNEYCVKQKIKSKRSLEYWIGLGLDEKAARKELKAFQSRCKHFWINKYGNEGGIKKYKEWVGKVILNSNKTGVSKSSQQFFIKLLDNLKYEGIVSQYYDKDGEEYSIIVDGKYKLYLDCYIEINGYKIGIEYNGDYWHANPELYESESLINYPGKVLKAKDVWKRDLLKKKDFNNNGISIITVWEKDVVDDVDTVINKIKEKVEKEIYEYNSQY